MNSRERVLAALNHRKPDRVPIDLGSTTATSITERAYLNLRDHLGLPQEEEIVFLSKSNRIVQPSEDILQLFQVDTRGLIPGPPDSWEDKPMPDDSYEDEWHIVRRRPPGGFYYDLVHPPLAKADSLWDLKSFSWPDPLDPGRTRGLKEKAIALSRTDYAIVAFFPGWVVLQAMQLRGFDNFLVDLVLNESFACALMDRVVEFNLAMGEAFFDAVGPYVDVVYMSDDVCTQQGPMMSPDVYRRLIKPRHEKLIQFVKERCNAKILFHSCGSIVNLLDDLIDIGIDAINPVQVASRGMADTAELKRRFGTRVAFWGAIDSQWVLPFGSPDDVQREVVRRIQDLSVNGGYVLAAVHNIQHDVPPANIVAMFQSARQHGTSAS
jgi:uroporphyrinogen decarboxylase